MTAAQKKALNDDDEKFLLRCDGARIDFRLAFGNSNPVIAEIGFGMGQATWQIAADHPSWNFLGIEVHTPGIGKLIIDLKTHGLENVRIIHHDAIEILEKSIPPESLAGIHLFYPDPWPKKRHHKRRIIRPGLAELMVSRLVRQGYLYFVTDVGEYADYALDLLSGIPGLRNRYDGFAERQQWRPETKFEARAKNQGRPQRELFFERI